MFTSNYYKILQAYQSLTANYKSLTNLIDSSGSSGTSITVLSFSGGYYIGGISLCGASQYNAERSGSLYYLSNGSTIFAGTGTASSSNAQNFGVILGDGDTQPTINDYKLAGNMITDFTATTAVSAAVQDDKIIFTGTYNITNTGASTLTIKEYALRIGASSSGYAIFNRGVFASPVVIEPGQTGIVTIEITFQN